MLEKTWAEEQPSFNFSECSEAATGEDTWDVGYRTHLANGREASRPSILTVADGTRQVRLRVINAGDTTNYHIDLGALTGELIAADGQPVVPRRGSSFWVAVAQRADIVVNLPAEAGYYPVHAVVEGDILDVHVRQSVFVIGVGSNIPEPGTFSPIPRNAPGMMRGSLERDLVAWTPLPTHDGPVKNFVINVTGDNGFMSINKRQWRLPPTAKEYLPNTHPLKVETGDRVCILLRNFNRDSHP